MNNMRHRSILILIGLILLPLPSWGATPHSVESYSPIVKKAAPAVVSISTVQQVNLPNSLFSNDPFFNFFFGDSLDSEQSRLKHLARSLGSGVIVDPAGIVITCAHVIENAKEIIIKLSDNREFKGKVIAKDLRNDLAVIRLKGVKERSPLPSVSLEKDNIEVGNVVLAIGNPFNVGQTVTSGIISAIARKVGERMLIQTDAPINPGNSGGALISMAGKLIGIPNAILSKTGASHGIGFAIPEPLIQILLDSVKNGGIIKRPWAGIEVQRLTPPLALTLDMEIPQGVLVSSLHPASPALAAGLTQGDVITALNEQNISNPEDFIYRIQSVPVGQDIALTVHRNGQNQHVTFQPIEPPAIPAPDQRRIPETEDLLKGIKVANLSPALASKYQLPAGMPEKGVIITDIGDNMFALQLKLTPGNMIEEVNQRRVESVADLFNILPTLQVEGTITIRKGNRRIEVKKRP
jgi:serine protease Do